MIELLAQLNAALKALLAALLLATAAHPAPVFKAAPQTVCETTAVVSIEGRDQVIFTCPAEDVSFTDALWFTTEEYDAASSDTIATIENERFQKWLAIANTAPQTDEPLP